MKKPPQHKINRKTNVEFGPTMGAIPLNGETNLTLAHKAGAGHLEQLLDRYRRYRLQAVYEAAVSKRFCSGDRNNTRERDARSYMRTYG